MGPECVLLIIYNVRCSGTINFGDLTNELIALPALTDSGRANLFDQQPVVMITRKISDKSSKRRIIA
ncbi:hypothetical protein G6F42_026418 [Rhizopus arrhizus]|nr:hypothetical protein G6F42_026418 [Rhizopus arrhizus]